MDIDEAFRVAGAYGPLQRRMFWSMTIPQIFVAWQHILNVFVGAAPRFQCLAADGVTNTDCAACDRVSFGGDDFTSIVSEWELVCGKAYKSDLVQSVFMAGLLLGNLIGGAIADQHGRRNVVVFSVVGVTIFGIMAASPTTAPNHMMYMVLRFTGGVCTGAYGLVSFTLPAEVVSSAERGFVNVAMTIAFALGIGSLAPLAYLIRDWRLLSLVTALPGLIGIYYYMVATESPRWLLSQGRIDEAERTLTHIATFNHGHPPTVPIKLRPIAVHPQQIREAGICDIARHPILRRRTLNNICTWFVNAMVYYGMTLKAGDLGSNRYVSIALSGVIEIPADVLTYCFMDRYGRRFTYSFSMLAGGLFCVIIMAIPPGGDGVYLTTGLALLGKIGISMSFCVCWMHAAEMYPTNIRNKALSICNMSSRLGGVFCPFVLTIGRLYTNVDFFIFGVLTLFAGLLSLKLPETVNRPMPETVEEIDVGSHS